jgi:putative ATP-dependent endonuclease of OLD family
MNASQNHRIVYELLGGTPADLLLPSNFIIVEGECELDLLEGIIQRFYLDKPKIQIVKAAGDHERVSANMEGINLVFKHLAGNPVYASRFVLLCDQPHAEKAESFRKFKAQNHHLEKRQLFELPVSQLESYYPKQWRTEVKLKPHQKINLARQVAKNITQSEFEQNMPIVFQALTACWEKAYKVDGDAEQKN